MVIVKIVCNHFGDPTFARLAAALRTSVAANCEAAVFDEVVSEQPQNHSKLTRHYTDNHAKLLVWRAAVRGEADDTELVLMDADTLVLGDLQEAFEGDYFDIGWTWRPGRLPMNGGVVFVRCNARSRAFFDAWVRRDEVLMQHRALADHGARKYGGANQAAFMWLLLHGGGADIARTEGLPCRKWNSVDQTWCQFDADTRVLHIKGKLREACIGPKKMHPFFEELKTMAVHGAESDTTIGDLAAIWRLYDPKAQEVAA